MRKRTIKNLKQLWLALPLMLCFITLQACSSDDDDNRVIGSWSLISSNYFRPGEGEYNKGDIVYQFSNNGTLTVKSDMQYPPFLAAGTYRYTIDEEKHVILIDDDTYSCTYYGDDLIISERGFEYDGGGYYVFQKH